MTGVDFCCSPGCSVEGFQEVLEGRGIWGRFNVSSKTTEPSSFATLNGMDTLALTFQEAPQSYL